MNLRQAYVTLGVSSTADSADVKAAYRHRARATHPDRGGDAAEFILVQAAYEVICAARGEQVGAEELPIPAELREMIRAIIADFQAQLEGAQELTEQHLDRFEREMRARIARASRAELRGMSTTFSSGWNGMMSALFSTLNSRCAAVVGRYERWADAGTERVFRAAFAQELRGFPRSRRFWGYAGGSALGVVTVAMLATSMGAGLSSPGLLVVLVCLLAAGPVAFVLDARRRRPHPPAPTTMAVEVFRVDPRAEFRGSAALREGRRGTMGAGAAGLLVGEAVAGGFAASVVGAAVGLALGGAVDRLANPTERVREQVAGELAAFMRAARPAVLGHVTAGHQQAAAGLQERLLTDYEERMKRTVRVLAGAKSEGVTPGGSKPEPR